MYLADAGAVNLNTYVTLGGGGGAGGGVASPGASAGSYAQETARMNAENKRASLILREKRMELTLEKKELEKGAKATGAYDRSTVMLSISMFVTVLIVRQLTMAIQALGKQLGMTKEEQQELAKGVSTLNALFGMIAAPMQLYIMWNMIAQMENAKLATTFIALASSAAAAFSFYAMITAETRKLRGAYAALATITLTLAAAQWVLTAAKMAGLAAVPVMWWAIPIALGLMAASIGAVYAMSAPRGETAEGAYRTVERSGPIYAHAGEKVGRITAQEGSSGAGGNRSITIISNDPYRTAKMVERYDRRGLGNKRIKRTVA